MRSLRARLLVGMISGMVLLLAVFSVIIYKVTEHVLIGQFDASLMSTAQMLAVLVEYDTDDNRLDVEFDELVIPEFQKARHPAYYQICKEDGSVLARSDSLAEKNLLGTADISGGTKFLRLKLPNGKQGRALLYVFRPMIEKSNRRYDQPFVLAVARYAGKLEEQLEFLAWLLFICTTATIFLSFIVAAVVVKRGLKPLKLLSDQIASIKQDNLTAKIGPDNLLAEIEPIKNRLNDLLARLEVSFNRERRFTADVAHELRTPLAGIRSTLEVTLARIRDVNEYQASLSDCLAISKNMARMVDNLLTLARLDTHQITFRRAQIQLAELVNSCWLSFSDRALQREIIFANSIGLEMTCESDPENLSTLMSNLLDNAVEYTNNGGRIWTTARQSHDTVEITVANTGCKLTNEQVSQVFESFWRGDSSRSATGTHCGLGLGLVQRIVRALGGSVIVEVRNGGIFTVRLTLPANGVLSS